MRTYTFTEAEIQLLLTALQQTGEACLTSAKQPDLSRDEQLAFDQAAQQYYTLHSKLEESGTDELG